MIFTKLNTLIMEIMVTVLSIVKHDILIEQMGGEKFLLAMIFFIVCLISHFPIPKRRKTADNGFPFFRKT